MDIWLFGALCGMDGGACFLNWGRFVILPEVFLKACPVARNVGPSAATDY